jgi:hypothetical protein
LIYTLAHPMGNAAAPRLAAVPRMIGIGRGPIKLPVRLRFS